ncbi:MAG: hypothetical protein ABEK29_08705 [Bradymonadaceae bacterium]
MLLVTLGCSRNTPEDGSDREPCREGRTFKCYCTNGSVGAQKCLADGTLGSCQCDENPPEDAVAKDTDMEPPPDTTDGQIDADPTSDTESDTDEAGPDGADTTRTTENPFRAFPTAQGYGANALTSCDRSKLRVVKVTNRKSQGPGSLRRALEQPPESEGELRIVVFRTGGTITAKKYTIRHPCIYVAGQTAPGDGVQLRYPETLPDSDKSPEEIRKMIFKFGTDGSAHDIALRYLRLRAGRGKAGSGDNISVLGGHRIVFDHLSSQWSNDENISIRTYSGSAEIRDVTLQRSIVGEALPPHSTGSIIGRGKKDNPPVERIALHRNLYVHNSHRNPRVPYGRQIRVINNVVYNWNNQVGLSQGPTRADFIGNFWKRGPWGPNKDFYQHHASPSGYLDGQGDELSMHFDGNYSPGLGEEIGWNSYTTKGGGETVSEQARRNQPLPRADTPIRVAPAKQARDDVLDDVGATARLNCKGKWVDITGPVDRDIIQDVRNGEGPDSDDDLSFDNLGGFPSFSEGTPCPDDDGDGMPNGWETRVDLDPDDPSDNRLDPDGDGYANIEEYLNGTLPGSR